MKNILAALVLLVSLSANAVTEIKGNQLDKEIQNTIESVIVVDLYADWCGPCKVLAPMLEKSEKKFAGRVKFFKINADKDPDLKGKLRAYPTVMIVKKVGDKMFMGLQEGLPESQKQLDDALEDILKRKH